MMVVLIPIEEIQLNEEDQCLNEQLYDDIKKNGLKNPIEVMYFFRKNKLCPLISDGHHRFVVLKVLGYKMIPCIVLNTENWNASPHP